MALRRRGITATAGRRPTAVLTGRAWSTRPATRARSSRSPTRYVQDASCIRRKNLTIDYNFPRRFVNKIGLQALKIYVSGENLLTFTAQEVREKLIPGRYLRRRCGP